MVFAPTEGRAEPWTFAAEVAKYTALLANARPAITLGASGGATTTVSDIGGSGVSVTFPTGPQGYDALEAGIWFDGTYEFPVVTGVLTTTAQGTNVYIDATGDLTLTATSNTFYGTVNYPKGYVKAAGVAPVKVGG